MRAPPAATLALLAALAAGWPAPAAAQRTLSPRLRAVADRDTTVLAWLLARPGADLGPIVEAVRAAGGRVRHTSRFLHGVSARVPARALRDLARRPDVRRVQPVGIFVRRPPSTGEEPPLDVRPRPVPSPPRARPEAPLPFPAPDAAARRPSPNGVAPGLRADTLYGPTDWPYRQLNVAALHGRGLRGAGVRIALLDAGFNTLHPLMAGATIVAERDFVYGDSVVRDQPGEAQGEMAHGTAVWSILAARQPGTLFGLAPDAGYLLAKTEFTLTETRVEEDHWVAAVEWADSIGVDIISSSLGYLTFDGGAGYTFAQLTGDVAVTTVAADSAAARGILVVVSVGNGGPNPRTLGTPADGDSVVAVGATDSTGQVTSFSSRGPTADGRIKPDVVAPGLAVPVAAPQLGVGVGSGTSFSAPYVTGIAALVQGTRPGRPAVELRRGLADAASRSHAPDNSFGRGIPNALALYAFPTGLRALGPASGTLATLSPTLSWDAGTPPLEAGPNLYRLRLTGDSAFSALLLDTTIATTAFTLPVAPRPQTRLFWRVLATSGLGVVESTSVRGPLLVPEWVTLLTLASPSGHSIRDSLPRLAWSSPGVLSPPGPFRYDAYVYPAARDVAEAVAVARGLADTTFQPTRPLEKNLPFRWRVVAHLGGDSVVVTSPGTFVVLDETAPMASVLFQSFPNPFPNPALGASGTCIWFDVAAEGDVRLEVFDLRGRLVRRLAPGPGVPAVLTPGRYGRPLGAGAGTCDPRFVWDGRDQRGDFVRPGVYVYRLIAPGIRESKRVVFLGAR